MGNGKKRSGRSAMMAREVSVILLLHFVQVSLGPRDSLPPTRYAYFTKHPIKMGFNSTFTDKKLIGNIDIGATA